MGNIINPNDIDGIRRVVRESKHIYRGKSKVNQVFVKEYGSDKWEMIRDFESEGDTD